MAVCGRLSKTVIGNVVGNVTAGALMGGLTLLMACAGTTAGGGAIIKGQLLDESSRTIASSTVKGFTGDVVNPDSAGFFEIKAYATPGQRVTVAFKAPGYADVYRILVAPVSVADLGVVRMRPVDVQETVTLPAEGEDPVSVTDIRYDSAMALTIPANSMVTADGNLAAGQVTVNLTYWHPQEAIDSAPSSLVTLNNNVMTGLSTYGMASMEVWQNGNLLQVAPGAHVDWTVAEPNNLVLILQAPIRYPNAYYVDPNTGMWTLQGTPQDGTVEYTARNGQLVAHLPHLSEWNLDGLNSMDNGGCMMGTAYDACNPTTPLPDYDVTLWMLGFEETASYVARTNSAGGYCLEAPISNYTAAAANVDWMGTTEIFANYLVAASSDITNTNYCDPLPAPTCRQCDEDWGAPYWMDPCNSCQLIDPEAGWTPPPGPTNDPRYPDTCNPPTPRAVLTPCSFCPGDPNTPATCTYPYGAPAKNTNCAVLNPVYIRSGNCSCAPVGAACGPNGSCCPGTTGQLSGCNTISNTCQVCNVTGLGTPCNAQTDTCCPDPTSGALQCVDDVCVPAVDPTTVQ